MAQSDVASLVSVIVPTHSRAAMLVECLDALLAQTVKPLEIIVVDDASTDDTPGVVARYGPAVSYVRLDKQSGKSVAVNLVLDRVQGELVWIFDDDDVAFPTAIERLSAPLIADPTLGFSYGSFTEGISGPDGRLQSRGIQSLMPDLATRGLLTPLLEVNFLGGARMLFRTAALRAISGFNPQYLRSQDYDVAIRMVRHARGALAAGGPLYLYRVHESVRLSADTVTTVDQLESRWLEYDRRIIGELLRDMPLHELLPAPNGTPVRERTLLLQRAGVYASKLLFTEMLADFEAIAALGDDGPLTAAEAAQAERMLYSTPMYGLGDVLDDAKVVNKLRALAGRSIAVRQILQHAARSAPAHAAAAVLRHRRPRQAWRVLRTSLVFRALGSSG